MNNIVLTGMMGSGKSSVAKELAKNLLSFVLVEIDNEIEKVENLKITQIFAQKGEKYFREKEAQLINKYADNQFQIISLGGGAFLNEETRKLLNKDFTIYLSAKAETIFNRLKQDDSRPLLQNDNSIAKIQELIDKRKNFYKLAKYEIKTDEKTIKQIVKEIMEKYEQIRCKN